jgi:hypothetical protein
MMKANLPPQQFEKGGVQVFLPPPSGHRNMLEVVNNEAPRDRDRRAMSSEKFFVGGQRDQRPDKSPMK